MIIAAMVMMSVITLVLAGLVWGLRKGGVDPWIYGILLTMHTSFIVCLVIVINKIIG